MKVRRFRWWLVAGCLMALLLPAGAMAAQIPTVRAIKARVRARAVPYEFISLRVYRLFPDVASYAWTLPGPGRYSFPASPGLYAVVKETLTAQARRRRVRLVMVTGGQASSAEGECTAGAGDLRISIGNIAFVDSGGNPITADNGKPMTADMMMGSYWFEVPHPCPLDLYVDRQYDPAFKEIVKELRLAQSDAFTPESRALARQGLGNLRGNAPTTRITGTIPVQDSDLGSTGQPATIKMVDLATGDVVWEKSYPTNPGDVPFDLLAGAAADIVRRLCLKLPRYIDGSFTGHREVTNPTDWEVHDWQAEASLSFDRFEYYDPSRPGVATHAAYKVDFVSVSSFEVTGQDLDCSYSGSGSYDFASPPGYLLIDLNGSQEEGYAYDSMIILAQPAAFPVTFYCTVTDVRPFPLAADLFTKDLYAIQLPRTDLATFSGTASGTVTNDGSSLYRWWDWTLYGSGEVLP